MAARPHLPMSLMHKWFAILIVPCFEAANSSYLPALYVSGDDISFHNQSHIFVFPFVFKRLFLLENLVLLLYIYLQPHGIPEL
jgi:hypothetical protein